MQPASAKHRRGAPDRPAHAPKLAFSWNYSSRSDGDAFELLRLRNRSEQRGRELAGRHERQLDPHSPLEPSRSVDEVDVHRVLAAVAQAEELEGVAV